MDIMSSTQVDKRFSYNGEGIWRMRWSYAVPSCSMINDDTGETMEFGQGCIMSDAFKEIEQ
jgi:hypothetical protein